MGDGEAGTTRSGRVVACPWCGKKNRVPAAASGIPRCGNCHRPLPWLTDAGDDTFADVVEVSSVPVLVEFWAPWCGPCQIVAPILEDVAERFAGRLKVVKVDVDRSPAVAGRFGVRGIPLMLMTRGGDVLDRLVGAAPGVRITQWVSASLPEDSAAASSG